MTSNNLLDVVVRYSIQSANDNSSASGLPLVVKCYISGNINKSTNVSFHQQMAISDSMSRRIRAVFNTFNFWTIVLYNVLALNSLEFAKLVANRLLLKGKVVLVVVQHFKSQKISCLSNCILFVRFPLHHHHCDVRYLLFDSADQGKGKKTGFDWRSRSRPNPNPHPPSSPCSCTHFHRPQHHPDGRCCHPACGPKQAKGRVEITWWLRMVFLHILCQQ